MKAKSLLVVPIVLALTLAVIAPASALFVASTGQAATLVLGQPDFVSSTAQATQNGMSSPSGVAVDPTTGKVFVADLTNNRVLRFGSVKTLTNGAAAEAVLGQPDFTSTTAQAAQNGMDAPAGIAVDANGVLWVADSLNNRVLRFDGASSKVNGDNADGVLGQPDFTTTTANTTQNGMSDPLGVAVDASGRLWVADSGNSRVLRFETAAAKVDGDMADGVLGQPDFISNAMQTTQAGLNAPAGLTADVSGALWVADSGNNRVLRFDSAATKANGDMADGVLGQPDFVSSAANTAQSGLSLPTGVALDSSGALYVADSANSRILVFASAAGLANGADASTVLGQVDFVTGTANTGGISAATLSGPRGVFVDPAAKVLWAADAGNNRALLYGTAFLTRHTRPFIGIVQTLTPPSTTMGSISIMVRGGAVYSIEYPQGVRILPKKRVALLQPGAFVTILTHFDTSTNSWMAFQIVVHPAKAKPGWAQGFPTPTPTPSP